MITMSFKRFGNGIYISHTDVLRSLNRTMRRAKIGVNYSNGFNKHMSLKLTQPLPLGVASDDEWVTVDLKEDMDKETFLEKVKANCPPFIEPKKVYYTEKNPALAASVTASDYEIFCPGCETYKKEIEDLKNGFFYIVEKDGETKEKDSTGLLYDVNVEKDKIFCRFAFGRKNFRVDNFLKHLKNKFGLDVPLSDAKRVSQLIPDGNGFITATEYMEKFH